MAQFTGVDPDAQPVPDEPARAATPARPATKDEARDHDHGVGRIEVARIGVAAICTFCLWFAESSVFPPGSFFATIRNFVLQFELWPTIGLGSLLPEWLRSVLPAGAVGWIDSRAIPFSTFGAVGLAFSGWPLFKEAFHNIRERRMTMELSITIAILAGAYTGHYFVAMFITFFVLIAEVLEELTVQRGRRNIRELLDFLPRNVRVRRGESIAVVHTDDLAVGETVLVAPGERIAVDGVVIGGNSFVDESRITGESMPAEKMPGGRIFAGSINQSGALEIRVRRIGADTSYGKIIEVVERAESSRAPVIRIADELASYIIYFAICAAAWTQWRFGDVDTSISVLIVAGACGVAAGTPLAVIGAIGRAAKLGAIVKGGVHMEMLTRVDTVVFDKTGTLTLGTPRVKSVVAANGAAPNDVLAAAASAEFDSEHPLGKAIIDHARRAGVSVIEPETFAYTPGRGIAATVASQRVLIGNQAWMIENDIAIDGLEVEASGAETYAYVARDARLLGIIAIADVVRPEARNTIATMQAQGIRTLLLTGDNRRVAEAIGRELGISEVEADLLPKQKHTRIEQLIKEGRIVAMVGDGINDAPAIAVASVGVAMGSGTDIARESAAVVLLGNDLDRFAETLALARRAKHIIWQNFAGTIITGLGGIALAYMGVVGPIAAVQIHTASELLFILNSARLSIDIGSELRFILSLAQRQPGWSWFEGLWQASSGPASEFFVATRKVGEMFNLYALRPAWTPLTIILMVVGFIIYWPVGLVVLAYILAGDRIPEVKRFFADGQGKKGWWRESRSGSKGYSRTGNAAFDEYREREMKRLEEERKKLDEELRAFEAYMHDLRMARDREEFDRFKRDASANRSATNATPEAG